MVLAWRVFYQLQLTFRKFSQCKQFDPEKQSNKLIILYCVYFCVQVKIVLWISMIV